MKQEKEESFLRKDKREFCEGCMVLGLSGSGESGCVLCNSAATPKVLKRSKKYPSKAFDDLNIGRYLECVDAVSKKYQSKSSAGGLVTSTLDFLLEKGHVTGVISVAFNPEKKIFEYRLFDNAQELVSQQRSSYYPVRLDDALEIIRNVPGRYAITGIPAAIRALEIIRRADPVVDERLAFVIGLVSGGVKITDYLDYLLRKAGKVDGLEEIDEVSFRDKGDGNFYHGSNYYFSAKSENSTYRLKSDKIPYNWSAGVLKEFSSDFCDDTFNILSDMTVMDGWLKRYEKTNGVSLAVVRSEALLEAVLNNPDLTLNKISTDDIIQSQRGGLTHKTVGIKARMKIFALAGNELPAKDVPGKAINPIVLLEQFLRLRSAFVSRILYARYKDDEMVDRKLRKYVIALKVINKIRHKLEK